MAAILDVTGGVYNISGADQTLVKQPLEQTIEIADFNQIALLMNVWQLTGTNVELTVSIYTAFQNTLEDTSPRYNWLLAGSFPVANYTSPNTGIGGYSLNLVSTTQSLLRFMRWEAQFTAGTGTLAAAFSIKGFARTAI